ncbi:hypothetical protein [Runella aurantiaca]|uniref:Uncharacterized protein n=1 Tax=Runella aurantiaca TaxID=2282308 RepID=A0A369I6L7_9BACT|nr:hypothetical protein [Runella aurantiaca]RDB05409.1 hypothetical protein DVG78_14320 [Runella aurantiaca]
MKTIKMMTGSLLLSVLAFYCYGQQVCSAAFLDNKIVVNEYTPTGKCSLPLNARGELTVATAELSLKKSKPVENLPFKIAIRDENTKTLTMFSGENYRKIEVQQVLVKCKKGDSIVLLTLEKQYALPHNEILVK